MHRCIDGNSAEFRGFLLAQDKALTYREVSNISDFDSEQVTGAQVCVDAENEYTEVSWPVG